MPETNTAEDLDLVTFQLHAPSPAEPEATTGKLVAKRTCIERQPGGQPFDNRHEPWAVRLACGEEAQHQPMLDPGNVTEGTSGPAPPRTRWRGRHQP